MTLTCSLTCAGNNSTSLKTDKCMTAIPTAWPLLLQNSPGKRLLRGEFKVFCKPHYFSRHVKSAKST